MTGLNCSDNPTGSLPKYRHVALLGTTVVVCLSLAEPVFADNFIITGDQTTTNGGEGPINGNDSVTLNGTITTTTGYGISTTGGSNKISIETGTLDGSNITTSGAGAHGIYNKGKSNETTIESGGSIETTGIGAIGVFNEGGGNTTTVEVEGSISTKGDQYQDQQDGKWYSDGIHNTGGNNTTDVSGTVTTRGNSARGIFNAGGSNTTTLSGSIIIEGKNAKGIVNNRDNNETTITETGSIKTTGTGSLGIRQIYDAETLTENILTVEGSISTNGKNARGISNEANGNKTTVS
ncbi:MAG: hypothetical protein HOL33_12480, partial [Tateyamaria sp.]|nr:hypothetical protein [Tateyamaria sp.]